MTKATNAYIFDRRHQMVHLANLETITNPDGNNSIDLAYTACGRLLKGFGWGILLMDGRKPDEYTFLEPCPECFPEYKE